MNFLIDLIRESVAVFVRAAPFLLFGFFVAGLLKVLMRPQWFARALGRRDFRSVFLASLAGVPLPLCSCSVLPSALAIRQAGASKGATASFLISTPETGVDSISVTYALMDPIMTVARPVSAFATAMVAGTAVNLLDRDETPSASAAARPVGSPVGPLADGVNARRPGGPARECKPDALVMGVERESRRSALRRILDYAYGDLLDSIAPWFILGIFITGLIGATLPANALQIPLFSGLPSMLIMLAIGIPLYVCATASTPIAAALVMKGLNPGAALVFMLSGPATNAASLTVLVKTLGARMVAIYLASIAIMSLVAGAVVNVIYSASGIDVQAVAGHAHGILPRGLESVAALVLLALIIRSAVRIDLLGLWRENLGRLARRLGIRIRHRTGWVILLVVIFTLYGLTGVSSVGPGEVGWVVEFGRVTRTVTDAGLVTHWPYPIARLVKVRPDSVRSVERGFRTTRAAALGDRELAREAEVAAGDENLVAIRYSVQYQVSDPFAFHFRIAAPDTLIGAACEFALRQVMSGIETDSILVDHRPELETRVAQRLRAELDAIGAGISVLRVDFIDVHAPTEVHFSFRDVASAMEDRLSSVHQAESYRGDLLAGARGRAYSTVARARADSAATIASAAGRGRGFAALERATRSSRDLTRLRLYLDAAGRLLRAARVILPLVDLPVDLWIDRTAAARGWPAPIAPNTTGFPGGPGEIGGPRPREAGANPGEPAPENEGWRDKLQRLQESQR